MAGAATPHQMRAQFGKALNDVLVSDLQQALSAAALPGDCDSEALLVARLERRRWWVRAGRGLEASCRERGCAGVLWTLVGAGWADKRDGELRGRVILPNRWRPAAATAAVRAGDECVVGTEDLLPACIFILVRARLPKLYSQAKLMYDFLPDVEASGPVGFNLMMLQSSLGYIMTKSVTEVRADLLREEAQQEERFKKKVARYKAALLATPEAMAELCDCPYASAHRRPRCDSTGRALLRGTHVARGSGASRLHGIYYGGGGDLDVVYPATMARDGTPAPRRSTPLGGDAYSRWQVSRSPLRGGVAAA